jgi:hypothetical protein
MRNMFSHLSIKRFLFFFALALIFPVAGIATESVAAAAPLCDKAQFVADVTIPDGTKLTSGAAFKKIWRLRNVGTCNWTPDYALVFSSGELMNGPASVQLTKLVQPNETVDVSVDLIAPKGSGNFRGYWKLMNASGAVFGLGVNANSAFWVDIRVDEALAIGYNFVDYFCAAQWIYDGGPIPCPYRSTQARYGRLERLDNPLLETGMLAGRAGILTLPQQKYNGYISGIFPEFDIFPGDRFQATIGCEYGSYSCYVTFALEVLQNRRGDLSTYFKYKEKYDGRMTNIDVDLSPIAWKKNINLVLTVNAYGLAYGDDAIWLYPIVVRPVYSDAVTVTPPTAPPTSTATLPPNLTCDRASMITDVTVPDGTTFTPGAGFTKTWRLKNVGTCTWTTGYSLVYSSGAKMGGQDAVGLPYSVAPDQTVDVSVNLIAPPTPGTYQGFWMLRNAAGQTFGIGSGANSPFWVKINVSGTPITPIVSGYDFVANACAAQWFSGADILPCPGSDGDARGYVLTQGMPQIESGGTDARPGLLLVPKNENNGYIQGIYPAFTVKSGDRFQSTISCEYNSTDCFIVYRLDYQIGAGAIQTYWTYAEHYDGQSYNVDLDLSPLAGQSVKFILTVLANGSPIGDRALWIAPRIYNVISGPLDNPTFTFTPLPTLIVTETPTPFATDTPSPTETPSPSSTP